MGALLGKGLGIGEKKEKRHISLLRLLLKVLTSGELAQKFVKTFKSYA
jgi:hypothetical protein